MASFLLWVSGVLLEMLFSIFISQSTTQGLEKRGTEKYLDRKVCTLVKKVESFVYIKKITLAGHEWQR